MSLGGLRALDLFIEALAGRPLPIDITDDHRGWPETLGLPDPGRVGLPAAALDRGDAGSVSGESSGHGDEGHSLLRARALHHWALIEFGTYGPSVAEPDPTACLTHPEVVAAPEPALAAGLLVLLEHFRVDAATRRHYPGSAGALDDLLASTRRHPLEVAYEAGLVAAVRLRCLGASRTETATRCRRLSPADVAWLWTATEPLTRADATLDDSARAAIGIAARAVFGLQLPVTIDDPIAVDLAPDEDAAGSGADHTDGNDVPTDGAGSLGEPDPETTAVEQPGGTNSEALPLSAELDQLTALLDRGLSAPTGPGARPEGERVYHYDEWNYRSQRYAVAWCRLLERRVHGADVLFADKVRQEHADLAHRIRRQLSLLRPEDRVRVPRVHDGDEIDLDAVIESIVDRRSGAPVDDRVTIRREQANRDVATAFLIDLSASTSSPVGEPDPPPSPVLTPDYDDLLDALLDPANDSHGPRSFVPKRRIIDVAKESVLLMCDALDELGDRHGVYGFSGHGRHHVEFCVAKELDEPASRATANALGGFEPIRYTRMGPAIRHTAAKLAASGARTRLLIIISDGHPQDSDYGPDRGDKAYGVEDTAKAILEAAKAGVDAYCLTIDPAGTDYLGAMFPEEAYLVIDEVQMLPSELAKLYGRVARPTLSAERARSGRRSQSPGTGPPEHAGAAGNGERADRTPRGRGDDGRTRLRR